MTAMEQGEIPARVEVGSAVGHETVAVPVRLVNAFGVAIPGGSAEVSVQGEGLSVSSTTVNFDYSGYGLVQVSGADAQAFTVSVVSSSDGAVAGDPATSYLLGGAMPDLGLPPAWTLEDAPERFVVTRRGVAWADGDEVWWQPAEVGAPPWRVATMQSAVDGIRGLDVDADGLKDLAVWSGTQVVVLRGTGQGGFEWGVGYEGVSGVIVDAAAGLLDDDVTTDLVFAWSEGNRGGLQPFVGDGVWNFEADWPWDLAEDPWSIGAGDFNGDGQDAVAVMSEGDGDGVVRRMGLYEDGWVGVGQSLGGGDVAQAFRVDGVIEGVVDINGDGVEELVFGQHDDDGGNRTVYMVNYANGVLVYDFRYSRLRVGIGDLSGDGIGDFVITEDDPGDVHLITVDSEDGSLFNRTLGTGLAGETAGIGELTGDSWSDLLLAREGRLELHRGGLGEGTGLWSIADEGLSNIFISAIGPSHVGDFDGDGVMDVLVFREAGSAFYAQRFRGTWDAADGVSVDTSEIDRVQLSLAGGEPIDLAVCGSTAYVLVDYAGVSLWSVSLSGGTLSGRALSDVSDGIALDCGEFSFGQGVAVLTDSDEAVVFNTAGVEQERLGVDLGSEDIAVVRADDETSVLTCTNEGCAVISEDLDGDGQDEWLFAGDAEATSQAFGAEWSFDVTGAPSAFDVDGDGRMEWVLVQEDQLAVVRTLSNGFAPPALLHTRTPFLGPAGWADVDGDSQGELIIPGEGGRLLVSVPSTWSADSGEE